MPGRCSRVASFVLDDALAAAPKWANVFARGCAVFLFSKTIATKPSEFLRESSHQRSLLSSSLSFLNDVAMVEQEEAVGEAANMCKGQSSLACLGVEKVSGETSAFRTPCPPKF